MLVREAMLRDAPEMSVILHAILREWGSDRPSTKEHVAAHYIEHPDRLKCSVAVDDNGMVLGFQSLKVASDPNPYDLPVGWGIIGTYVAHNATGQGVGKKLFASTLQAARMAGIEDIDATIGDSNEIGLRYYDTLGFRTYRTRPGAVCKRFCLRQT